MFDFAHPQEEYPWVQFVTDGLSSIKEALVKENWWTGPLMDASSMAAQVIVDALTRANTWKINQVAATIN